MIILSDTNGGNQFRPVNKITGCAYRIGGTGGEAYLDLLIQHVDYKEINDAIKTLLEKKYN